MEPKPGKNFTRLIENLIADAPFYNVFQAIFLCELISKPLYPDRDIDKFEQTGLNFRPYENYVYPPKDIRSFEFTENVMTFILNFMGLYGINSPLPRCYHEQIAQQQDFREPGKIPLQNFLDIFNNRFYWLYYQAWKKYRYYLHFSEDLNSKTMQRVFTFIGQGTQLQKEETSLDRFKLLQCSGILCNRARNKTGLLILLKEFFPKFNFQIKEFIPHMVKFVNRPLLGKKYAENGFQLGVYAVIGNSMLDLMSRICVEVGPIDFEEFLDFLPDGKNTLLLKSLLNLYLNDGLEYDIKLIIRTEGIRAVTWRDPRVRLGLTMWLGKPKEDLVEVYYNYDRITEKN